MTRAVRLLTVGALTAGVALVAWAVGAPRATLDLIAMGGGVAAGELLMLRPALRAPLPLSFAVFTVVARAATPVEVIVIVLAGELLVLMLQREPAVPLRARLVLLAERCMECASAAACYQAVTRTAGADGKLSVELVALTAAAVAPIAVSDGVAHLKGRPLAPLKLRGADVAMVSSGILMALSNGGIKGSGGMGLWGPILFSIPLVAAWYSFELLGSTTRNFDQTIRALAAAPELGGYVRVGHSDRVADLAIAMARMLDVPPGDLQDLETAARLHHLGAVCLDEPADGASLDPAAVAASGAEMLRASQALAPAGNIVAAEPLLHRAPGVQEQSSAALLGMILKVASAYDDLTEGNDEHAAWAVEALYTGPGYVYDGRVLAALESVLAERSLLRSR